MAASMGSFLLAAGTPGKRFAMPNSRILIHQPHLGEGGIGGQITDIEIHAKELVRTKTKLTEIYAQHTGQDVKTLHKMMERDYYLSAAESKKLGLIDEVILSRKKANALVKAG
jgi:ATP-dependent Clp protease protease subunit